MGLQFNYTDSPSKIVAYDLDKYQFFRAYNRTGALFDKGQIDLAKAAFTEASLLDYRAQALPSKFGPAHYIKLREVFIDDKNGDFTMRVDYLHDESTPPAFTEEEIKCALGHGSVQHFGQGQWVEVSIKTALFSSDYFSPVADEYYRNQAQ